MQVTHSFTKQPLLKHAYFHAPKTNRLQRNPHGIVPSTCSGPVPERFPPLGTVLSSSALRYLRREYAYEAYRLHPEAKKQDTRHKVLTRFGTAEKPGGMTSSSRHLGERDENRLKDQSRAEFAPESSRAAGEWKRAAGIFHSEYTERSCKECGSALGSLTVRFAVSSWFRRETSLRRQTPLQVRHQVIRVHRILTRRRR